MNEEINKILDFWFGEIKKGFPVEDRKNLWYMGRKETDNEIKNLFGNLVKKAGVKELDDWKTDPKGRLALIILLDQFTRNVYRKKKEAFANNSYTLALCKEGLELKQDKELLFVHRWFFYHPLAHSENLQNQELFIELIKKLGEEVSEDKKERIEGILKYAIQHRDIIKRFGRFPYRNEVLERESTKEEIEYSKTGKRFGQ